MPGRTLAHLVILSSGEFRGCLLRESATRTTVVPFAGVGHCRRVPNCRRRRPWARFTASGVLSPCPFVIQGVSGAFERRQLWLHYRTGCPVGRWRPSQPSVSYGSIVPNADPPHVGLAARSWGDSKPISPRWWDGGLFWYWKRGGSS